MGVVKGLVGLAATAWIAAAVAYSVSAPRNVEDAMNQPMDSLGGQSINQQVAATQAEVRREQCARYTQLAQEAWDRAIEQGTADRDAARLDEMDRMADKFCKA